MNSLDYREVTETTGKRAHAANDAVRDELTTRTPCARLSLTLRDVVFTGRVPVANWTLVIALEQKLWRSEKKTLFFGEPARIGRCIHQQVVMFDDNRFDLPLTIAAYNNYGDVLRATRKIRCYRLAHDVTQTSLLRVEHDWTQLSLNFSIDVLN